MGGLIQLDGHRYFLADVFLNGIGLAPSYRSQAKKYGGAISERLQIDLRTSTW
jgi:hypothetical protein